MARQEYLNLIDETGRAVIPDGMTEIGDDAFRGCTGLKSLKIPKGLGIDEDYFWGCENLKIEEY